MTKKEPDLEIAFKDLYFPDDWKVAGSSSTESLRKVKYTRGIVTLESWNSGPKFDKMIEMLGHPITFDTGFLRHAFWELDPDHGIFLVLDILNEAGLTTCPESAHEAQLIREIKSAASEDTWALIQERLKKIEESGAPEDHRNVWLTMVWAQLKFPPFGTVWLAAVANFACYVLENDYMFGYIIALLDQKRANEQDALRGKGTVSSAAKGGKARATESSKKSKLVLDEMKRLIEIGNSVANAARIVHARGKGTSPEANRALWKRNRGPTRKK